MRSWVDLKPGGIEQCHADMIVIGGVVMALRHLMRVAVLSMKGAMIGLSHHRTGPMLHRLDGGGNRQRHGYDQARAKRPDPCPSC
jgi:hypothetical protein